MTATTIFIHNGAQFVRLPAGTRFPDKVKKVDIRVVGEERIIASLDSCWDSFFYGSNTATDDFMTERER